MALACKHGPGDPPFTKENMLLGCFVKINIYKATNFHFRHSLSSFRMSRQWTAIHSNLVLACLQNTPLLSPHQDVPHTPSGLS